MDLLSLRYFQAVARREHLSRAAEDLRVAQPSLSRSIARLEADLGVPLFDRTGRALRLNRFGAAFLRRVDRALRELDDARTELTDAAGLEHGSVSVAAETLLTLTGLLTRFRTEQPGVDVRLFQSSAATMTEQLRRGEVDLCFASQPLGDPAVVTEELLREEVLLAVPPGHPLASRERTDLASIADEPIIATRPGFWQRTLTDRLFAEAGLTPDITCESDEPAATQDLISAGIGIGLVPAMSRRAAGHAPVAWLHLDAENCERSLDLARRGDAYLSVAARHFRRTAIDHFRT
ncbi:LysR family transcriptional regulator [Amycolatopsis antarctica]|uniref:LysR family transcriptional regulator n=1 Tax=Amycolatopsis antarctica TaxID=1854586 RepID=A0A263CY82_9PSEU|nr:LysR family transcriptional regulator [Amycolatopsis antarctica]OZM70377.1 LysR family transcriptional regulator [Amycolatopsis antarctica]